MGWFACFCSAHTWKGILRLKGGSSCKYQAAAWLTPQLTVLGFFLVLCHIQYLISTSWEKEFQCKLYFHSALATSAWKMVKCLLFVSIFYILIIHAYCLNK